MIKLLSYILLHSRNRKCCEPYVDYESFCHHHVQDWFLRVPDSWYSHWLQFQVWGYSLTIYYLFHCFAQYRMFSIHHNQLQLLLSSKEFKIQYFGAYSCGWTYCQKKLVPFFSWSLKLSCHEFDGVIKTLYPLVEMEKTGIIYFDQIQEESFYFKTTDSNRPQPLDQINKMTR